MESGQGVMWTGSGSSAIVTLRAPHGEERHSPADNMSSKLPYSTDLRGRKTNLSRSASLSEKELKEARDRSHIIAAQLSIPSNVSSRGVHLFNRCKERVNAFTLVSFGRGTGYHKAGDEEEPHHNTLAWEDSKKSDAELNHGSSEPKSSLCSSATKHTTSNVMEIQPDNIFQVENQMPDRDFLCADKKEEAVSGKLSGEMKTEIACSNYSSRLPQSSKGNREISFRDQKAENGSLSMVKQKPTIINRTARPFGSADILSSPEIRSPVIGLPQMSSQTVCTPPAFSKPPTAEFHSKPPALSYSPSPISNPAHPPPLEVSGTPPSCRIASPPPCMSQYPKATVPKPQHIPQHITERKQPEPNKTGILDEGKARQATRKSMFTFQEKPKVAPNPELLSLVQGVDEKKLRSQPDYIQEEELLALGAEASNFLTKDMMTTEEAIVPQWSSCLKRAEPRIRPVPKPELGLTNASGKGAELFARRQSRMEKYVIEAPSLGEGYVRSPSPTMSLPPSWVFSTNIPAQDKANAGSSRINVHALKTAKATPTTPTRKSPGTDNPVWENGCNKRAMEISKHQPYQLNSSLFILNPTKDPMNSLPKGAPPPKPVIPEKACMRQLFVAKSPIPFSPRINAQDPFTSAEGPFPHVPLSPVNGLGSVEVRPNSVAVLGADVLPVSAPPPEYAASPKSATQAPRPTYSAKKAGIQPQIQRESLPTAPTSWTLHQLRQLSNSEEPSTAIKASPASGLQDPSPLSPTWESRCQSPRVGQDDKANLRLLAKNIISAAKRRNSPSPGGPSSVSVSPVSLPPRQWAVSPFRTQSPTITSPPATPTRFTHSPVCFHAARSLTDSDASVESEDSGLRSLGTRTYNTCPRGWGGSLRMKTGSFPADL
ncbi:synaptopodin [Arapaima gigas]